MCWNIDGVQNKFEFQSMIDYLKSYNVFGLLGTWEINLEKYSKLFPDHKCFVKMLLDIALEVELVLVYVCLLISHC